MKNHPHPQSSYRWNEDENLLSESPSITILILHPYTKARGIPRGICPDRKLGLRRSSSKADSPG